MAAFDDIKPDIVEVPNSYIGPTRRVPIVVHLHDSLERVFSFRGSSPIDNISLRLVRRATRRAAAVVSPSHLLAEESKSHGWQFPKGVTVIALPIEVSDWRNDTEAAATEPIVLYAGFLGRQKGVDVLVDAMAGVQRTVPNARLRLIGHQYRDEGPDAADYVVSLRRQASEKGIQLEILDPVPRAELRKLYAEARVVVQAARFDNFPTTVLEAMSAARPVVVSSMVGSAWLVRESSGGAVATAEDPLSFQKMIEPFLEDPGLAQRTGLAGQQAVERHCAPLNNARRRADLYRAVIESRLDNSDGA
jgi:2-deoxystreptamine N-acetyl-D-glucosaminyltransferase/2-deoxystreptamine glucosyltransferase